MTSPQASGCSACGKPTISRNVFVTMWLGAALHVIDDVPAHVCDDCGLQFYDPEVEAGIRALVAAGFPAHQAIHHISVPVFRLAGLKPVDPLAEARFLQQSQEVSQS